MLSFTVKWNADNRKWTSTDRGAQKWCIISCIVCLHPIRWDTTSCKIRFGAININLHWIRGSQRILRFFFIENLLFPYPSRQNVLSEDNFRPNLGWNLKRHIILVIKIIHRFRFYTFLFGLNKIHLEIVSVTLFAVRGLDCLKT